MAQLEYIIATGKLSWIDNGKRVKVWIAKSGPKGNGVLPRGHYEIRHPFRDAKGREKLLKLKFAYCPTGKSKGFFIPIYPLFHTERNHLGIHPDGGNDGTHGCIGIQKDAYSFFNKYTTSRPHPVRLLVK